MSDRAQRLREIQERYKSSTSGEWTPIGWKDGSWDVDGPTVVNFDQSITEGDAKFIAHAHQDIPWLLAEIERLDSVLAGVENLNDSLRQILVSEGYNVERLEHYRDGEKP